MTTETIYDNMVWDGRSAWLCDDGATLGAVEKIGKRFHWTRGDDSVVLGRGVEDTWEMAASFAMQGDTYVDLETEGEGQDMITEVVISALLDAEDKL